MKNIYEYCVDEGLELMTVKLKPAVVRALEPSDEEDEDERVKNWELESDAERFVDSISQGRSRRGRKRKWEEKEIISSSSEDFEEMMAGFRTNHPRTIIMPNFL
jgi:hypothetical protein